MSRAEKKLEALRQNPLDRKIEDLESIAHTFSFSVRKASGSHVTFSHPSCPEILTVPAKKPIKAIYIKKFIALIDQIRGDE